MYFLYLKRVKYNKKHHERNKFSCFRFRRCQERFGSCTGFHNKIKIFKGMYCFCDSLNKSIFNVCIYLSVQRSKKNSTIYKYEQGEFTKCQRQNLVPKRKQAKYSITCHSGIRRELNAKRVVSLLASRCTTRRCNGRPNAIYVQA